MVGLDATNPVCVCVGFGGGPECECESYRMPQGETQVRLLLGSVVVKRVGCSSTTPLLAGQLQGACTTAARDPRDDAVVLLLLDVRHQELQLADLRLDWATARTVSQSVRWQSTEVVTGTRRPCAGAGTAQGPQGLDALPLVVWCCGTGQRHACACVLRCADSHTAHTLLPDSCMPLRSSRFTHSSTPSGSKEGGSCHLHAAASRVGCAVRLSAATLLHEGCTMGVVCVGRQRDRQGGLSPVQGRGKQAESVPVSWLAWQAAHNRPGG